MIRMAARRRLLCSAIAVAAACSPIPVAAPTPAPVTTTSAAATQTPGIAVVPSPSPVSSPAVSPALRGTTTSLAVDRDTFAFFADGPRLFAVWKKEGPAPYESRVLVADGVAGSWRTLYTVDAFVRALSVAAGRVALVEYREPPQGGGAYSEAFVVVDLSTGRKTEIASHSLSPATYRGGGGGPRRPVGSVALGEHHVAYTRLVEGAGGTVTGELYVAPLDAPASARRVTTSIEWVSPLGIGGKRLVYLLGTKTEDQLRLLEVDTGLERTLARAPIAPGDMGSPMHFAVVSSEWAMWLEGSKGGSGSATLVNLRSGDQRSMAAATPNCGLPSASAKYIAWWCRSGPGLPAVTATILDARTLAAAVALPSNVGNEVIASGDGLIWTNVAGDGRRVTYFVPSP